MGEWEREDGDSAPLVAARDRLTPLVGRPGRRGVGDEADHRDLRRAEDPGNGAVALAGRLALGGPHGSPLDAAGHPVDDERAARCEDEGEDCEGRMRLMARPGAREKELTRGSSAAGDGWCIEGWSATLTVSSTGSAAQVCHVDRSNSREVLPLP